MDISYLNLEDLRTLDRILTKAETERQNDRRRTSLVDAATAFADTPNGFNLEALQEAERELMAEEEARDRAKFGTNSEPSGALVTPTDASVATTTPTQ